MRLLVVEDDAKLVRALERGLAQEGYAVDIARTGEEALSHLAEHDYGGGLLDVMLPGVDGFAACEELRRADPWLPVLMLTPRAEVAPRIRGLDAGADDYLVQPFAFRQPPPRRPRLSRHGTVL